MNEPARKSETAILVQKLAAKYHVTYVPSKSDVWAHHIARLVDNEVVLDPIETMLIALQRAGHLSRREMVQMQARYLREIRS